MFLFLHCKTNNKTVLKHQIWTSQPDRFTSTVSYLKALALQGLSSERRFLSSAIWKKGCRCGGSAAEPLPLYYSSAVSIHSAFFIVYVKKVPLRSVNRFTGSSYTWWSVLYLLMTRKGRCGLTILPMSPVCCLGSQPHVWLWLPESKEESEQVWFLSSG